MGREGIMLRPFGIRVAFWGLLLIIVAVGCGSSGNATPVDSSTPGRPAGSAALLVEPTETQVATILASPTPQSPRA